MMTNIVGNNQYGSIPTYTGHPMNSPETHEGTTMLQSPTGSTTESIILRQQAQQRLAMSQKLHQVVESRSLKDMHAGPERVPHGRTDTGITGQRSSMSANSEWNMNKSGTNTTTTAYGQSLLKHT